MKDIPTTFFLCLRNRFFDCEGKPIPFVLRDKASTQDDPFDEHLAAVVISEIQDMACIKAPGPLITPDLVVFRPSLCSGTARDVLREDLQRIVGFEVKKLERQPNGMVVRASGLDYNTTPPCGHVRVYDETGAALDVRGFYVFACVERIPRQGCVVVTSLAVVDGDLLNADFDFYLSIVGEREKRIGLGTYGDGADRTRPMLIFSNPLGIPELNRGACLIHPSPEVPGGVRRVHVIKRTTKAATEAEFSVYRACEDVQGVEVSTLLDPMPVPLRNTKTRQRGRFLLPFRV